MVDKDLFMKILIAPNAFKGTIMADDVANAIKKGITSVSKEINVISRAISDGGDGSLDSFIKLFNGTYRNSPSTDPLGRRIEVTWGVINNGKTAFIETALTFGLALLENKERNPSLTTSTGIGDLIKVGFEGMLF